MANTYTQLYIQIVFSTKFRKPLIQDEWKEELFQYISGIITAKRHKSIIVNGDKNHIHIFTGLNPSQSISDLTRDIKSNSSKFINERNWCSVDFNWQGGYGAFSYSRRDIENVYNYILNQEEHHRIKTFETEYIELLDEFGIEYDVRYVFD